MNSLLSRRLYHLGLIVLFSVGITSFCFSSINKQVTQDRPNIVWITSEDNSKHYMALFDKHGVATPHLAGLAEEGLRYHTARAALARAAAELDGLGPRPEPRAEANACQVQRA